MFNTIAMQHNIQAMSSQQFENNMNLHTAMRIITVVTVPHIVVIFINLLKFQNSFINF